jgi:NifB/MoaA-like Fe-S oxidoreductase
MDQLRELLAGGLAVHTQVVLCPGWNDGAELDRTIRELYALGDGVLSLSVVPVGLTRYNLNRPVRLLNAGEADTAIRQTNAIRHTARDQRGHHWCYAADELYLIAGRDVPPAGYYDDWPLVENGVGALRSLLDGFDEAEGRLRPADGVGRVRIVTGTSMSPFFERMSPVIAARMGCDVEVLAVENGYFGPSVTIAGLLPGADIMRAASDSGPDDLVVLPATALNDDGVFIDGLAFADVAAALSPAAVRAGHEVVGTLVSS